MKKLCQECLTTWDSKPDFCPHCDTPYTDWHGLYLAMDHTAKEQMERAIAAEQRLRTVEVALNNLRQYVAIEGADEQGDFISLAYQGSILGPIGRPDYDLWEFVEAVEKWLHAKIDRALAAEPAAAPTTEAKDAKS